MCIYTNPYFKKSYFHQLLPKVGIELHPQSSTQVLSLQGEELIDLTANHRRHTRREERRGENSRFRIS